MPFTGIADSEQLKLLTAVLDEYCTASGILDQPSRKEAATRVMSLFMQGVQNAEQLRIALALENTSVQSTAATVQAVQTGP